MGMYQKQHNESIDLALTWNFREELNMIKKYKKIREYSIDRLEKAIINYKQKQS